jgi:radical SAM superfamily enzyme YgiQ (UPF0313 family)
MAESGCMAAIVGFESLQQENLDQMNKHQDRAHYARAIQRFHERGIMVYGTFVFGYDHDTPETFEATLEFAQRARLCLANFNPLTPTPGTRLYERLRAYRRLIYDRWWLDPTYRYGRATFQPRGMTADELTEGCFRARRQFYGYSSILSRVLLPTNRADLVHLAAFWASNLISRKEILKKQGHRLGSDAPLPPLSEEL